LIYAGKRDHRLHLDVISPDTVASYFILIYCVTCGIILLNDAEGVLFPGQERMTILTGHKKTWYLPGYIVHWFQAAIKKTYNTYLYASLLSR